MEISRKRYYTRKYVQMRLRNDWILYLLFLPVLVWYIMFSYIPMAGLSLSFRNFRFDAGIWHSPWIGLSHFTKMFSDREFMRALGNTAIINIGRIAFQMPCAIFLALMLNEFRRPRAKKLYQTVVTFPHFVSWVVLGGVLTTMFSSNGVVNQLLKALGVAAISPITTASAFRPFLWLTNIWKEIGWDSIIYMAAIAGIDPGLYEAAEIDGAGRWRRIWHVTLPGIRSTIAIMLILATGAILTNGSFDQIFSLYSAPVYITGDTIDTFIFRKTFVTGGLNYGYTTAIGFAKSLVGLCFILVSNFVVNKMGEEGLF